MRRSAFIGSAVLHVGVFALAVFGLPFLPERRIEDAPPVVLVDLAPITDVSNAPPPAPRTVEKPPEPKPEPPKQEATPAPPPPPPPQPVSKPEPPAPPPPPPKVAEPEPAPAPKPLPKPKEVAEVPSPAPPKPVQKPTPPTLAKADTKAKSFDLADIERSINLAAKSKPAPAAPQPVATPAPAPAVRAQGPSNPNLPVSQSEKDFLRAQVEKYWNPDLGAKFAGELVVRVTFWINPDGTLKVQPTIVDRSKMGDPYYSAAANNAVRAVLRAEPFKLPPGDTARWNQEIELRFDPKDMLGG